MSVNRSSSFYSEAYFDRLRQNSRYKKAVYRQTTREFTDQEHELEINNFYKNNSGRCQMMRYYEKLQYLFQELKPKQKVKSDEYKELTQKLIHRVREEIKFFHENLMCNEYITRDQLMQSMTEREKKEDIKVCKAYYSFQMMKNPQEEFEGSRLECCNMCPIYIQNFEANFQRVIAEVNKHSQNWEKLNGGQKLSKLRILLHGCLRGLKNQLQNLCEFSKNINNKIKQESTIFVKN